MADNRVDIYSRGIVACSVCAPNGMPPEQVVAEVNKQYPSGIIGSSWTISSDSRFQDGSPMPFHDPPGCAGTTHWLLNC